MALTITFTPFQEAVITAFAKANNITPAEYATLYLDGVFNVLADQFSASYAAQLPGMMRDDTKRPQLVALLTP